MSKTIAGTYLYSKYGEYEKAIFDFAMNGEIVDKKDPGFEEIVHDVKRRQISSALSKILMSDKVILLMGKRLPKPFKVNCIKDIRNGSKKDKKIYIDCSDIFSINKETGNIKCRDIVLAKRPSGRYLLHRIIRINSDGTYSICGDNSYKCDNNIKKSDIIGKLTTIITNNKRNDLNGIWYKLYSYCWSNLFFIRKPLLIITKLQFNIWNTKSIKICRLKKL